MMLSRQFQTCLIFFYEKISRALNGKKVILQRLEEKVCKIKSSKSFNSKGKQYLHTKK